MVVKDEQSLGRPPPISLTFSRELFPSFLPLFLFSSSIPGGTKGTHDVQCTTPRPLPPSRHWFLKTCTWRSSSSVPRFQIAQSTDCIHTMYNSSRHSDWKCPLLYYVCPLIIVSNTVQGGRDGNLCWCIDYSLIEFSLCLASDQVVPPTNTYVDLAHPLIGFFIRVSQWRILCKILLLLGSKYCTNYYSLVGEFRQHKISQRLICYDS